MAETKAPAPAAAPRRVCYSQGLVLGVDEFTDEQSYFLLRDRLHHRALHGYGTVWGLGVGIPDGGQDLEVRVEPGLAIDLLGREITVPRAQCADLEDWFGQNRAAVDAALGSPPESELELFVVLAYQECKTDLVPIPGAACRSAEESRAPSRIAEDYELALSTHAPRQVEEDAVRRFGDLLGGLEVSGIGPFADRDALLDEVRALAEESSSPPSHFLPAGEAEDLLRDIFRVWVTEVRPKLLDAPAPDEDPLATGVLLARLVLGLGEGGEIEHWELDEAERPWLLTTRLLRERGLCGGPGTASEPEPWLLTTRGGPGTASEPGPPGGPEPPGPETPVVPLATIRQIDLQRFQVWFHVDPGTNAPEITRFARAGLDLQVETETDLISVGLRVKRLARNVFRVVVLANQVALLGPFLRFTFNLGRIRVDGSGNLADYGRRQGLAWVGQERRGRTTVTQYLERREDVSHE